MRVGQFWTLLDGVGQSWPWFYGADALQVTRVAFTSGCGRFVVSGNRSSGRALRLAVFPS